jgi:7-cyano-7-deazaguanine synthase
MSRGKPIAIVLVSGGLDSATTLAIAQHEGFACCALTFDYGQRHKIELEAARNVAAAQQVREHLFMKIDLRTIGGSALTADIAVPKDQPPAPAGASPEIPITYVPARNTIFLSFALAVAEVRESADIYIGVNAVDYSGYPDCRPEFIASFERMANLATRMTTGGRPIKLHTPLIDMTKAQIIRRGLDLGVDYATTFSCYDPTPGTNRPCGHCDSCLLRAAGFAAVGAPDPAQQQ